MAEKVLIVEDERSSRRALVALLQNSGYEAQGVGSAEEALVIMRRGEHPHIALVDVDLPGMDGIEFTRRLEAMDPTVTAIFITAAEGDRIAAIATRHAGKFLRKPLDFDRLLTILSTVQQTH